MGLVLTLVLLIAVGGLGWWKFGGSGNDVEAGNGGGDETVADANEGTTPADGDGTTDGGDAGDGEGTDPDAAAGDGDGDAGANAADNTATDPDDAGDGADDGAGDGDAGADDGGDDAAAPAPSNEVVEVTDPADLPRKDSGMYKIVLANKAGKDDYNAKIKKKYPDALYDVNDAAEVDLAGLDPFGAYEGTDDELWAEITSKVEQMCDSSGGARQTRAQRAIEESYEPQQVVPALINAMCQLDFVEDARTAEMCLQTLGKVVRRRFGWSYSPDEPNKVAIANRRSVAAIHDIWTRILSGEKAWEDWYYPAKKETQGDPADVDELGGGE
jgi:hypothetical protein